jgi:hypothetical protein
MMLMLCMTFVTAAMSLPSITNALGPKYRHAGQLLGAGRLGEQAERIDYSRIKVNVTIDDYLVAIDAQVFFFFLHLCIISTLIPSGTWLNAPDSSGGWSAVR